MDADRPRVTDAPFTHAVNVRDDIELAAIAAADWDALTVGTPLLSHAFLLALHETGCVAPATGWTPRYLTAWRGTKLVGALPLYAKMHSYGEYVFDWAWADAYRRYGRRYYPKLLAAIPFTPTPGRRILGHDDAATDALIHAALRLLRPTDASEDAPFSSLHILFPSEAEARALACAGMMVRHGLQFRWENAGYVDFAGFLATFSHDKRKKVKQERRRVSEAGIVFTRKVGTEIGASDWAFFYRCYRNTYRDHQSTPYLSLAFFERIGATMPGHVLMAIGHRDAKPICAALDVFDGDTLWGRYWGTTEMVSGLHFEACYYQAIEFCIERKIARFEGGAQGVHKLARGLVPVQTWSAHAIADPEFARVIGAFCAQERVDVAHAIDELGAASPFRNTGPEGSGE